MSRSQVARRALGLTLVCGVLVSAAIATPQLASGATTPSPWSVTASTTGVRISWHAPSALPITDAPLEVRRHGALLGIAREAGATAVLDLLSAAPHDVDARDLQLWRSGVRVDDRAPGAPTPAQVADELAGPAEPAAPAATAADPGR